MSCNSCKVFGDEKVKFPIEINLKVITDSENPVEKTKEHLIEIFNKLKIPYDEWTIRPSSKGKYISITVIINIDSEEIMNEMYKEIKSVPGVIMAM